MLASSAASLFDSGKLAAGAWHVRHGAPSSASLHRGPSASGKGKSVGAGIGDGAHARAACGKTCRRFVQGRQIVFSGRGRCQPGGNSVPPASDDQGLPARAGSVLHGLAPAADAAHACVLSHSLQQSPNAYTDIHMTSAHTSTRSLNQRHVFANAAHGADRYGGGALFWSAVVLRLPRAITGQARRNIPRSAARRSLRGQRRQLVAPRSGAKRSQWPAVSQRQPALNLTLRTPRT